ncbi:MAG TPA: hypothetical protein VI039_08465 [Solirubrobacterales bacterium]
MSPIGRPRFVLAALTLCLAALVLLAHDGGEPAGAAAKQRAKPGLPLRATPVSTRTEDNGRRVRLILRPVKRAKVGPVVVSFRNSSGRLLSRKRVRQPNGGEKIVALPLKRKLRPGRYRVRMVGRKARGGPLLSADQKLVFVEGGGWGGAEVVGGALVQRTIVSWSGGDPGGSDRAGFVAPGVGYGEIVCNPEAQYVRFYGSSGGRETAMMNWTYKDWGGFQEKSLREAVYTSGTGFDFNEGLNKFSPAEKTSTGIFEGVISDRGPIGGPGGPPLGPVTSLRLSWEWDFTTPATARCYVEAVFRTEVEEAATAARSVQIAWRGESNAATNGYASVDFPGLGVVSLRCQPGEPRRLRIESPRGARVITRESSNDSSIVEPSGPTEANLPNNGMVVMEVEGGERIVVASRWKLNDPDPSKNWCFLAGQVTR